MSRRELRIERRKGRERKTKLRMTHKVNPPGTKLLRAAHLHQLTKRWG